MKEKRNLMSVRMKQILVHATGMESGNAGMKPQGSATPDSNGSATGKVYKVL